MHRVDRFAVLSRETGVPRDVLRHWWKRYQRDGEIGWRAELLQAISDSQPSEVRSEWKFLAEALNAAWMTWLLVFAWRMPDSKARVVSPMKAGSRFILPKCLRRTPFKRFIGNCGNTGAVGGSTNLNPRNPRRCACGALHSTFRKTVVRGAASKDFYAAIRCRNRPLDWRGIVCEVGEARS
jgi:hypothetical protein